jgi:hypothetical protein
MEFIRICGGLVRVPRCKFVRFFDKINDQRGKLEDLGL